MHRADIKAELEKAGSGVAKVARQLKLRPSTVSMVVSGKGTSRRVARRIARITGIPVARLWPGKYPKTQAAQGV
jgi:lambda repressor-like predicted transcriptional regulator